MASELISKYDKYRIARLDNIQTAYMMVYLVSEYHTQRQAASDGLVLAICWEESFFQNIPQEGGPAVGFGQLEKDGRRIASEHYSGGDKYFSRESVLASPEVSIRAVSHCLAGLFEKKGSQHAALNAYAGIEANSANDGIPAKWKDCEAALQPLLAQGVDFNPILFEAALDKARQFRTPGPVYNHIHNKLFPFADVIAQINADVAIGAVSTAVAYVQDSLNRLLDLASGSTFSEQPLAVDGVFGQKTQARVIEFQNDNGLEADGIVGPLTRQAMLVAAQV